ncbi:MAG: adenosylcobinamide-GDP ribazoletransferase [Pikeienuella sp.]
MQERLTQELKYYLSAQSFLTRLPTPEWVGHDENRLARAAKWFPIVGLLLGIIAGSIWAIFSWLTAPTIAAGITMAALALLTGALHEDGFADCCDGLGGGSTTERALEIMRDSRIGAYGAVGLILSIGLRWSALSSFEIWSGITAFIIALTTARASMVLILRFGTYARPSGAADSAASGVEIDETAMAIGLALLIALILGGPTGLMVSIGAFILSFIWLKWLTRKIGGYTGDGLGAAEQISQIFILIALAGFWA